MSKSSHTWIERRLIETKAFQSLKSRAAYRVLSIFWLKRQCAKVGRKSKKKWDVTNNGEITFYYNEAKKKCHISEATFMDAIDELREKGFVDIAQSGAGLYKSANLYELSDRWKLYGTQEYKPPEPRPKGPINRGFQKGNKYGRNCKKKS
jgi:hypothetical protein